MRTFKTVFFLLALSLSLLFTSCAEEDSPTTPTENRVPAMPSNPSPAHQAIDQSIDVNLSWSCTDPDAGDNLTYDVCFGTVNPPTTSVSQNQASTSYKPPQDLVTSTQYFWKIVAKDSQSHSTTGHIWLFTTVAPSNQPPHSPSAPSPADQSTNQPTGVDISWSCFDPENDPLTYDVYFGTSSSPPLVQSEQSGKSYDPGSLNNSTLYFWKIVAKDNQSHSTTGPIWRFTTVALSNQPPNTPSAPSPADQSTKESTGVDLSWSCADPENDPITYDVYFGSSSSPPLVQLGQSGKSYDPGPLNNSTPYFWKIVATDNQSHSISGPVWKFTTVGNPGETKDVVISGVTFTFAWIPPGSFGMGSPTTEKDRDSDEGPVHTVTFADGFWMMTTELTQKQWVAVMGSNPSSLRGDSLPVESVSWYDIQQFETAVGGTYNLPSEAEWEYACRAGTTTRFYWGDDPNSREIGNYAWYGGNWDSKIQPVGTRAPNAWGLYDMCGNVWEWCEDDGHDKYDGAPSDGTAWKEIPRGSYRVTRGGSLNWSANNCRSARRFKWNPSLRYYFGGVRFVCR